MSKNDTTEIRQIISKFKEKTPERIAADVLTLALEEGRVTDIECAKIFNAFNAATMEITESRNDVVMIMDNYVKVIQKLNEANERLSEMEDNLNLTITWLHDPIVKPFFFLSVYIEMGLNWLRGKPS